MSEYIKVSLDAGIQRVQIARPEKKNALTLDMYAALAAALQEASADEGILVSVLTGSGDSYCGGNDIHDFLRNPTADKAGPVIAFVQTIIDAKKPLVAAVNGVAVGIGATMLLHCDLVYAAPAATFQFPVVNIGLCPSAGSSAILPALLGQQRAAELFLLGDRFDAETAQDWGMVNAVAADVEAVAMASARRIAAQPPQAVQITKGLLRTALRETVSAALTRESAHFLSMLQGAEAKEALSAFIERRKPDFSKQVGKRA